MPNHKNSYETRSKSDKQKKEPSEIKASSPTHTNQKQTVEKFKIYYNDSSDEEDINDKLENYDIDEQWEKLQKKHTSRPFRDQNSKNKHPLRNNELHSFVAHVAGIKLKYSKNVNAQYYPLKLKLLSEKNNTEDAVAQLQRLMKCAIKESATKTLDLIQRFLKITGQNKLASKKIHAACKKTMGEFRTKIDENVIEKLEIFIGWLKASKYCYDEKNFNEFNEFECATREILTEIFIKNCPISKGNSDRKKIKEELYTLANEQLIKISKKYRFEEMGNADGKIEAISLLKNYTGHYKNLAENMIKILKDSPSRGYVKNMISKKLDENSQKEEFIHAYIEDLIALRNEKHKNKYMAKKEMKIFKEYFTFNGESVYDELEGNFSILFRKNIETALKSFYQPTLSKNHVFSSDNPYTFLSNIRLSNRSQKRVISNNRNAMFTETSMARSWRFGEPYCPEADVVELHSILNSLGRRDIIEDLGNYEKVNAVIEQIKTETGAGDKQIAEWIRSIYKGKIPSFSVAEMNKISLLNKLQSITELLFGCEATRNPAMLVINQMLLDLILEGDEMTFEEAFTGKRNNEPITHAKLMPMVPEGAVASARALESKYRKYMPYPYFYPGIEYNGVSDLISLEGKMIRSWLELKKISPSEKISGKPAQWLLKHIESHFDTWLGSMPEATKERSRKHRH